jgi:hypothetical protein
MEEHATSSAAAASADTENIPKTFVPISQLEVNGITAADIKKLEEAGFHSVDGKLKNNLKKKSIF